MLFAQIDGIIACYGSKMVATSDRFSRIATSNKLDIIIAFPPIIMKRDRR